MMINANQFLRENKITITGIASGALGGFMYYYFIGCASGKCAITSDPVNSTLYGMVMGGLLFNMFQKKNDKNK